jgi:indolepyruvate ferredoxin oxidoreductase beta subunit
MNTKSVMIVGVGGQGSLLASKLLGRLLMDEGFDVKVSEVHGMSQRGGSVVTYVRFGEKVYSPIIAEGEADIIISFEKLEAARYAKFLKKDGKIVVNTQQIDPMPVIAGAASYPENLVEKMKAAGVNIDAFDALGVANEAGSVKAVNIALLGRLSRHFRFTQEEWEALITQLLENSLYEMVVLDVGESVQGLFPLLELCDRVYMPVLEDENSRRKLKQYQDNVEQLKLEKLNRITYQFVMPQNPEKLAKILTKEEC